MCFLYAHLAFYHTGSSICFDCIRKICRSPNYEPFPMTNVADNSLINNWKLKSVRIHGLKERVPVIRVSECWFWVTYNFKTLSFEIRWAVSEYGTEFVDWNCFIWISKLWRLYRCTRWTYKSIKFYYVDSGTHKSLLKIRKRRSLEFLFQLNFKRFAVKCHRKTI